MFKLKSLLILLLLHINIINKLLIYKYINIINNNIINITRFNYILRKENVSNWQRGQARVETKDTEFYSNKDIGTNIFNFEEKNTWYRHDPYDQIRTKARRLNRRS